MFEEFIHILKIFQLHPKHMSETEALHLFARYDDGDGNVSFDEYMGMMERIEERYCLGVLVKIGWDMRKLMKGFVLAVLCLLLLFFFIFMGIEGFSTVGSFGAVVNSMLPMSAGGITSISSGEGLPECVQEKIVELLADNIDDMIS